MPGPNPRPYPNPYPCSDPRCSAAHHDGDVDSWLAQEDARTDTVIKRHGWMVQGVLGATPRQPELAYTVGLWGFGHPELVVFGLRVHVATAVLNSLGALVREGSALSPGERLSFGAWPHQVHLLDVPHPERVLFQALRTYGRTVPALQAVWNDAAGRFPWDPGYCVPRWLQPLPGTAAWHA
jgi:Domain of unknown function (DUF4262)